MQKYIRLPHARVFNNSRYHQNNCQAHLESVSYYVDFCVSITHWQYSNPSDSLFPTFDILVDLPVDPSSLMVKRIIFSIMIYWFNSNLGWQFPGC